MACKESVLRLSERIGCVRMAKSTLLIVAVGLLILQSCGISESKQKTMQFWADDLKPSISSRASTIALTSYAKATMPNTDSYYVADFHCRFREKLGSYVIVELRGQIGFNEYGSPANVYPSGEGKRPIILSSVVVDGDTIPVKESIYNQPSFLSSDETIRSSTNVDATEIAKTNAVSQLKSWGATDAYFSPDNFLVYVVEEVALSAHPDEVAHSMFELFSDVPGIAGVRVESSSSHKVIGEYCK